MDGYLSIINRLSAEVKARVEIAAEDDRLREARSGRLRESGSTSTTGLFDLGPDVPKSWRPKTSAEIMREAELAETAALLRESAGMMLDDVPRPERTRMRELGSYGLPGKEVAFEDEGAYKDVCDLFSVLDQNRDTGSPSLENRQAESLGATMQEGKPLSTVQIGLLRELMARHQSEIDALRASPEYAGQNYTSTPDPGRARMVESARGEQVSLQPSSQQSDASPGQHLCPDCSKGLLPSGASCPTCKGSGIAPGRKQALAESGPLRGLLAPPAPPEEEVLDANGLFDLGPDIPRSIPRFMQVGPAAEQTPSVGRMRSSGSMRETAAAECHLLERFNREVANGKPRRLREARGRRTPADSENLTMREVRELCQEWEGVAA